MKQSREISRKSSTGNTVKRDKQFYLNSLDVESSLMTRAISLAERMFTAFLRENKLQVTVDADDVAEKILAKIGPRLSAQSFNGDVVSSEDDGFTFDDEPVILKTEKMEIKGALGKTKKSQDSTKKNLEALEGLSI